jgi:hypothetical protein
VLDSLLSYTYVVSSFKVKVVDPTNNDAKMKLAEIYEILNEPRKALELVYEGLFLVLRSNIQQILTLNSH